MYIHTDIDTYIHTQRIKSPIVFPITNLFNLVVSLHLLFTIFDIFQMVYACHQEEGLSHMSFLSNCLMQNLKINHFHVKMNWNVEQEKVGLRSDKAGPQWSAMALMYKDPSQVTRS